MAPKKLGTRGKDKNQSTNVSIDSIESWIIDSCLNFHASPNKEVFKN